MRTTTVFEGTFPSSFEDRGAILEEAVASLGAIPTIRQILCGQVPKDPTAFVAALAAGAVEAWDGGPTLKILGASWRYVTASGKGKFGLTVRAPSGSDGRGSVTAWVARSLVSETVRAGAVE